MKNIKFYSLLCIMAVVLFFTSCKKFKGYTINGEIKNANQTKVYLEDIFSKSPAIIDTATIVDNKFQIKNYSTKGIYRLRFGLDERNSIYLYIEEKDNIKIIADLNNIAKYKVEGSKASNSIAELVTVSQKNFDSLGVLIRAIKVAATPKDKDSLQTLLDLGKKNQIDFVKNYVEKEPNNDVACLALTFMGPLMQDEIPYLVAATDRLHNADPQSPYITMMYNNLMEYRKTLMDETQGGVALNTQAPNIILQTPNGDTIQLKNLQGNYVLLDFWASWCQPCRMENPKVVKLYNKYHAQGFEIFSVSLDANAEQWKNAIAKDGLVWKNHGCDFGGWNSTVAQLYNVKSIPCTFLLDKKGKIIAKDLRGDELATKLTELFPEQSK